MDKQFIRSLLPLVNDKTSMDLLQTYADARISQHLNQMSMEKDMERVKRIQGAVAELRRITTLRDEIITGAE
ncbi:MAG: hypothetical protein CBD88_08470 [Flavobacteriales bacterium TMED228]|nr:MAG: hypothetical protein CBD88_08470 [Flavobacteriales bacterium TMED228]